MIIRNEPQVTRKPTIQMRPERQLHSKFELEPSYDYPYPISHYSYPPPADQHRYQPQFWHQSPNYQYHPYHPMKNPNCHNIDHIGQTTYLMHRPPVLPQCHYYTPYFPHPNQPVANSQRYHCEQHHEPEVHYDNDTSLIATLKTAPRRRTQKKEKKARVQLYRTDKLNYRENDEIADLRISSRSTAVEPETESSRPCIPHNAPETHNCRSDDS